MLTYIYIIALVLVITISFRWEMSIVQSSKHAFKQVIINVGIV